MPDTRECPTPVTAAGCRTPATGRPSTRRRPSRCRHVTGRPSTSASLRPLPGGVDAMRPSAGRGLRAIRTRESPIRTLPPVRALHPTHGACRHTHAHSSPPVAATPARHLRARPLAAHLAARAAAGAPAPAARRPALTREGVRLRFAWLTRRPAPHQRPNPRLTPPARLTGPTGPWPSPRRTRPRPPPSKHSTTRKCLVSRHAAAGGAGGAP